MSDPDVTVITPVHNTDRYLHRWFRSLLEQSIGPDRIEVVAVDDGSTDGSRGTLERFAAEHPGLLTVVPLPDRAGPARARNRGLDLAGGRYLHFVDSDDYLGPEALERLVAMADTEQSDIVLGRMVGVEGRQVAGWIYRTTLPDVPFPGDLLPWSLNVTKLYRRALVQRYRLRFHEELPVHSDQPFALEAYFRSAKTSVMADCDCYFLSHRADLSNITLNADPEDRLRALEVVMGITASFTEPGPGRDAVQLRHFSWGLLPLLGEGYLQLDRPVRLRLTRGLARLSARHLSDGVLRQLSPAQRRRLEVLGYESVEELPALLRHERDHGSMPTPEAAPAAWQQDAAAGAVLSLSTVGRGRIRTRFVPAPRQEAPRQEAPRQDGPPAVDLPPVDAGPRARTQLNVPLSLLLPRQGGVPAVRRWAVRLEFEHAGHRSELPFPAAPSLPPLRWWHRGRPYRATPLRGADGGMVLAIAPIRVRRVLALRLRRVLPRNRPDRLDRSDPARRSR